MEAMGKRSSGRFRQGKKLGEDAKKKRKPANLKRKRKSNLKRRQSRGKLDIKSDKKRYTKCLVVIDSECQLLAEEALMKRNRAAGQKDEGVSTRRTRSTGNLLPEQLRSDRSTKRVKVVPNYKLFYDYFGGSDSSSSVGSSEISWSSDSESQQSLADNESGSDDYAGMPLLEKQVKYGKNDEDDDYDDDDDPPEITLISPKGAVGKSFLLSPSARPVSRSPLSRKQKRNKSFPDESAQYPSGRDGGGGRAPLTRRARLVRRKAVARVKKFYAAADAARKKRGKPITAWLSNVWKGIGPPHFTCEVCGEKFSKKFEFTKHLYQHRQEEAQKLALTCPDCFVVFKSEYMLGKHFDIFNHGIGVTRMNGNASDVSKLTCFKCNSRFTRRDYYKKHLEIHKRPLLKCPLCPEKFPYKFYLDDHIKDEHKGWTIDPDDPNKVIRKPKIELQSSTTKISDNKIQVPIPKFITYDVVNEDRDSE